MGRAAHIKPITADLIKAAYQRLRCHHAGVCSSAVWLPAITPAQQNVASCSCRTGGLDDHDEAQTDRQTDDNKPDTHRLHDSMRLSPKHAKSLSQIWHTSIWDVSHMDTYSRVHVHSLTITNRFRQAHCYREDLKQSAASFACLQYVRILLNLSAIQAHDQQTVVSLYVG